MLLVDHVLELRRSPCQQKQTEKSVLIRFQRTPGAGLEVVHVYSGNESGYVCLCSETFEAESNIMNLFRHTSVIQWLRKLKQEDHEVKGSLCDTVRLYFKHTLREWAWQEHTSYIAGEVT